MPKIAWSPPALGDMMNLPALKVVQNLMSFLDLRIPLTIAIQRNKYYQHYCNHCHLTIQLCDCLGLLDPALQLWPTIALNVLGHKTQELRWVWLLSNRYMVCINRMTNPHTLRMERTLKESRISYGTLHAAVSAQCHSNLFWHVPKRFGGYPKRPKMEYYGIYRVVVGENLIGPSKDWVWKSKYLAWKALFSGNFIFYIIYASFHPSTSSKNCCQDTSCVVKLGWDTWGWGDRECHGRRNVTVAWTRGN